MRPVDSLFRQSILLLSISLLLCASGCTSTPAAPSISSAAPGQAPVTYSVSGTVTTADGKPISGAGVLVKDSAPNPNAGRTTLTDADGKYTLSGLVPPGFSMAVNAAGYRGAEREISFGDGATVTRIEFVLAAVVDAYAIIGRVTGSGGVAVGGATITVTNAAPDPNAGKSATSDASGNFRISGLRFGDVDLEATAPGYGRVTRKVQMTLESDTATTDISLVPTIASYVIDGAVRSEAGTPISGATLIITDGSTGPNGGHGATTDGSGRFKITGLTLSAINSVSVSATGYKSASRNVPLTFGTETTTADFVLSPGETVYSIKGIVSNSAGVPIRGVTVSVTDGAPNPNAGRTTTSDATGGFNLSGLALANVTLSFSAPAYAAATRAISLTQGIPDAPANVALVQNAPFGPALTIGFAGIAVGKAPYSGHSEQTFTIVATDAPWYGTGSSRYGNSIQFETESGSTTTGKVVVIGDGRPFGFTKMDIYSSVTTIPWSITGKRNGVVVYQSARTQPNTYGAYVTIDNDHPTTLIDRLELTVTNPLFFATCPSPPCKNPVAIDTIVVSY